jgi:stage IV sporulation protein B
LTLVFSYELLISEVPDKIYITEGEDTNIHVDFPLVMSDEQICSLFGIIPIKEVTVSVVDKKTVYPCGKIIGFYTKTEGVFVIDTCEIEIKTGEIKNPSGDRIKKGDYILAIDGKKLKRKEDMVEAVSKSKGKALTLTVYRNSDEKEVKLMPAESKNGTYLLGIWVKDDQAGVGTMTYFTDTGEFGALGHGMGNGENGELLLIEGGDIYYSKLMGIEKGIKGMPGEVKGAIYYGNGNHLGDVEHNTDRGIFGDMDTEDLGDYMSNMYPYEVAHKQEIVKGKAQIISDVSGEPKKYDVEITYIDYLSIDNNKGLHITVTDPELLELTGGIVQGMSGSPVVQNGKLVGAVTHVLVDDPTRGYAIFAENMLETAQSVADQQKLKDAS